ncbi:MAG: damage-control phosphatase ARMT1 family protein [Vulcanimicrobiota bacterium]
MMKMSMDCLGCQMKTFFKVMKLCVPESERQVELIKDVLVKISKTDFNLNQVQFAEKINTFIKKNTGNPDPYLKFKQEKNKAAAVIAQRLKPEIEKSDDPLMEAIKAATAGNIMDLFAGDAGRIEDTLRNIRKVGYRVNHFEKFKNDLQTISNILYITDNAGEIFFDELLIDQLVALGAKVTVCVRGYPAGDDALEEDYKMTGLRQITGLTDTGTGHQGFVLEEVKEEAGNHYRQADLIIAKGMGNFESLFHVQDTRLYFLFAAKCEPIATLAEVEVGDFCFINAASIKADYKNQPPGRE